MLGSQHGRSHFLLELPSFDDPCRSLLDNFHQVRLVSLEEVTRIASFVTGHRFPGSADRVVIVRKAAWTLHTFEKMLNGPMHRWLLWDQTWMIQQLYRLRESGLLSKVSEIDRMRQFTTKFDLAGAMPQILALAEEQVK